MGFFDSFSRRKEHSRRHSTAARNRLWWETAAEFPADDPCRRPDLVEFPASEFDPQGGYTGKPVDGGKPVQDADDL